MEKIKSLNRYQKGILIFMIAMACAFAVIYPKTISKVGFEYNDKILVPSEENGCTVYAGKISGEAARFIVSADKVVEFWYGEKFYGPYTAKEDPSAIPKDEQISDRMVGVELREGDEIMFRGGVLDAGDFYFLYNEDGTIDNIGISYVAGDGIERDENGNPIDKMKPKAETILSLMNGPELTHKGDMQAWFYAVFICVINAISIIFADELFRFNLAFQIRNADRAEPSEWEIAGRYISWIILAVMALAIFVMGLL